MRYYNVIILYYIMGKWIFLDRRCIWFLTTLLSIQMIGIYLIMIFPLLFLLVDLKNFRTNKTLEIDYLIMILPIILITCFINEWIPLITLLTIRILFWKKTQRYPLLNFFKKSKINPDYIIDKMSCNILKKKTSLLILKNKIEYRMDLDIIGLIYESKFYNMKDINNYCSILNISIDELNKNDLRSIEMTYF